MNDLFGNALFDYYKNVSNSPLLLHNKFSDPDILDLEGYFFDEYDFSDLENYALELCKGKILDIGAAAGRHCLYLQEKGYDVTGLDISTYCCNLMQLRGVLKTKNSDAFHFSEKTDTILMLMNGIGLVENLQGLQNFLDHAKKILNKNGQIIFDSSDVKYLRKKYNLPEKKYIGEIDYQYEYKGIKGDWFTWLYIDPKTLQKTALQYGWKAQIIFQDENNQFLARLFRF